MNGISYMSHNVLALLTLKVPAKSASKNVVCLSSLLLHVFATCNIIDYVKVFFCLFVFLLYLPSQQLWSWRDGSVHLTTLFLGQA